MAGRLGGAWAWAVLLALPSGGCAAVGLDQLCVKPRRFPPDVEEHLAPRPFSLVCGTPSSAHFLMDARSAVRRSMDKDQIVMDIVSQGPVPWSVSRFNQGDFAPRLGPRWASSQANLGVQAPVGGSSTDYAAAHSSQAWRPHHDFGVVLPTVAKNGEDWGDGRFYGTAAISLSSAGFGYSMSSGTFGNGDCDVVVGKAGDRKEGTIDVSVAWLPYSAGFPSGFVARPRLGWPARWQEPGSHSPLLPEDAAEIVQWHWGRSRDMGGNRSVLTLPGYGARDGMLFAANTDAGLGNNDLNIVSVMPVAHDSGWQVQVHEDFDPSRFQLADMSQWMFCFIFVPFAGVRNLHAVHVDGVAGVPRRSAGGVEVLRVSTGRYWLRLPGKGPLDGVWLLQCAAQHRAAPGTLNAFLSYEWSEEAAAFVVEVRHAYAPLPPGSLSGDESLHERFPRSDADFFALWMDHRDPPSMAGFSGDDSPTADAGAHGGGAAASGASGSSAARSAATLAEQRTSPSFTSGFFAGVTITLGGVLLFFTTRGWRTGRDEVRTMLGRPTGDGEGLVAPL